MPEQKVTLEPISRDDVSRIKTWLEDEEISESWFGRYSYGDPAHLGYHPAEVEKASDAEWERVFSDPEHRMLSIYTRAANRSSVKTDSLRVIIVSPLATSVRSPDSAS